MLRRNFLKSLAAVATLPFAALKAKAAPEAAIIVKGDTWRVSNPDIEVTGVHTRDGVTTFEFSTSKPMTFRGHPVVMVDSFENAPPVNLKYERNGWYDCGGNLEAIRGI